MASKKQHPHVGMYTAMFAGSSNLDQRPLVFGTPEAALEDIRVDAKNGAYNDGDIVYVYAVVGVKKITKPTLTENLVVDTVLDSYA